MNMENQNIQPINTKAELREMMGLALTQYQLSPQTVQEIANSFLDIFDIYMELEVEKAILIRRLVLSMDTGIPCPARENPLQGILEATQ